MISCYFGVPGVGKTTLASYFTRKYRNKYKHIYTNFYCKGVEQINFKDLGIYKIYDSLIILDELTLDADSRDFKSFPPDVRDFFVLHRHVNCDIIYLVQDYGRADKIIKDLTYDLWYLQRSVIPFFSKFLRAKRIYRHYKINEERDELVLGYRYPNWSERFFDHTTRFVYCPKYYKYFNTHDELKLANREVFESCLWDPLPSSSLSFKFFKRKQNS